LLDISISGDYDPWVEFFATAVKDQADDMVQRVERLLEVRAELLNSVRENKIRGFAVDIIEDLIGYSSITPTAAAKRHNVQYKTANDAVKRLQALGILVEVTGASYGRIFVCPRVRDIVVRP
jgi:cell filamentation protein, protein adenylyltransferase